MITNIDYISQLSLYNRIGISNTLIPTSNDKNLSQSKTDNQALNFDLNKKLDNFSFDDYYKRAKLQGLNKKENNKEQESNLIKNSKEENSKIESVKENALYQASEKLSNIFNDLGFSKEESKLFSEEIINAIQTSEQSGSKLYEFSMKSANSFNLSGAKTKQLFQGEDLNNGDIKEVRKSSYKIWLYPNFSTNNRHLCR